MMPRLKLQWTRARQLHAGAQLRALLRELLVFGAALVLLVPAVRGHHPLLGWGPLWLLAMPALACWAAHGFALPQLVARRALVPAAAAPRRAVREQARRRRRVLRPAAGMTTGRGRTLQACASVRGL